MRILVTGSRDWDDERTIRSALLLASYYLRVFAPTIVHGACPSGADAIADRFAVDNGWPVERHPAKWGTFGKSAGFVRNKFMVDTGASLCLAFIKNDSKGASMTARLAEEAGIPTMRFVA